MSGRPKDKPTVEPAARDRGTSRDPVSSFVVVGLVGLGVGGILAIFSGPLLALFTH